jgi:hypothetical protein
MIIGCDFHTRYQTIAMLDEATGELTERRLDHQNGEAEAFYRNLQGPVRLWGSKPPGRFAGSNACSRNWVRNFGSATPPGFAPVKCASRKPMSATPGTCSIYWRVVKPLICRVPNLCGSCRGADFDFASFVSTALTPLGDPASTYFQTARP